MKKILAALLVVVMVVSLFPATVLANSDECAVAENYGTHSKEHCDKLGVKYTQFGESVAPKCGQNDTLGRYIILSVTYRFGDFNAAGSGRGRGHGGGNGGGYRRR